MKLKILIVSSVKNRREFYSNLFKGMDNICQAASSGKSAINSILQYQKKSINIDLVFTDYHLKDMDGITLGQKLKEITPSMNLILFPHQLFHTVEVRAAYIRFGGFMQEEPEASLSAFEEIFQKTQEKVKLLRWINKPGKSLK